MVINKPLTNDRLTMMRSTMPPTTTWITVARKKNKSFNLSFDSRFIFDNSQKKRMSEKNKHNKDEENQCFGFVQYPIELRRDEKREK